MICAFAAPRNMPDEALRAYEQQKRKHNKQETTKNRTEVYLLFKQRLCQIALRCDGTSAGNF